MTTADKGAQPTPIFFTDLQIGEKFSFDEEDDSEVYAKLNDHEYLYGDGFSGLKMIRGGFASPVTSHGSLPEEEFGRAAAAW